MNTELTTATAIIAGLIAALWYWNGRMRRVPLSEFGLKNVERVLRWETSTRRQLIMNRGWMTSHEWTSINQGQLEMIDAELKRRQVPPRSNEGFKPD